MKVASNRSGAKLTNGLEGWPGSPRLGQDPAIPWSTLLLVGPAAQRSQMSVEALGLVSCRPG